MSSSLAISDREAVREQLERILASHFFRNSKRFPDFLRYTVEHALEGSTNDVKERTLGIEVFGRQPDYDTSLDPVVRVTAGEVRKRLAQYYQMPGHENEPRIEFPLRSYVPEFSFGRPVQPAAVPLPAPVIPEPVVDRDSQKARFHWQWMVAALLCSLALCAFALWKLPSRESPLDQFWSPIQSSSSPVLLCISDSNAATAPMENPPPPDATAIAVAALPAWYRQNHVSFGDTLALTTLAGFLGERNRSFRVRRAEDAELRDMQEGPVILIGGRNNPWSMELNKNLRFSFLRNGNLRYISDRTNPSSRQWSVQGLPHDPGAAITEDYALISRVFDPVTGRPLLTAAGILAYATEAAGQCLTDDSCLAEARQLAGGDWQHKNIQIVIATQIIGEAPGKPRVLAAYVW